MAATPPSSPPPPPTVPVDPGEPSNRWPWLALALGLLVIVVAAAFFFINRQRSVNVTVAGAPTQAAVVVGSPSPPPTLVPPTLPPSATLAPTATPAPSPTPAVTPTSPPASPTALPAAAPPPTVDASAPPQPAPPGESAPAASAPPTPASAQATQPPQPTATAAPAQPAATSLPAPTAAPSPTAFAGQAAGPGGLGNTRADVDAAFGAPAGETPEHLVVYRKGNLEYHVRFVPDPSAREAVLVGLPQPAAGPTATPQAFTLDQAVAEAHRLLPKDAQPPSPQQEGNPQFVVERFTSQTLAQALPANVFAATNGQPGQFLAVYVRDAAQSTRITRFVIGAGNDPNAIMSQGR